MATQVQFRGGTTSQHGSFTGAVREVTVDTDKETLVVHDGSTAGGFALLRQSGTQPLTITTADNNPQLTLKSTDADSGSGAILEIQRDSGSPADGDGIGQIKFTADNDAGQSTMYGTINGTLRDASDGTEDGQMQFSTIVNGSNADFFRYGVGGDGEIGVIFNDGSIDADFRVESNGNTHAIMVQGGSDCIGIKTASPNDYYADDLVLTAPDEGGMTIVNSTSHRGYLAFADGTSGGQAYGGFISYDHNIDTLYLGAGANNRLFINTNGAVTMPAQPAFSARISSNQLNFAVGSEVTVAFNQEFFDIGGNFNTSNYTFTAPVTGKYQLNARLYLNVVDTASAFYILRIVTSNATYVTIIDPNFSADVDYLTMSSSMLVDMDASDTATITIHQNNGTQQTHIIGADSGFNGILVA